MQELDSGATSGDTIKARGGVGLARAHRKLGHREEVGLGLRAWRSGQGLGRVGQRGNED